MKSLFLLLENFKLKICIRCEILARLKVESRKYLLLT